MDRSPFDFWEENGNLEFQSGNVRIYNVERDQYLFVDQTIYASTTERAWYIKNLMPVARGNVLEIGLGLGCASKVILANNRVNSLLTVEENEHVIAGFGRPLRRHLILMEDVNRWVKKLPRKFPMYDLIFVDHYTLEDEEETIPELGKLAVQLEPLLKDQGNMVFWIDENIDDDYKAEMRKLWLKK